ncbi:MAG: hypothetical protein LBU42_08475 [Prevotellaceae bacterium]|jgi:hypothetical protein|nr:hypothetical protein [Prevotellaceae bacterium]
MKKIFFLLAMLAGCAAFAQATVTPISVDYDNQQVTFGVEWTTAANNRVWVWVDFCSVAGAFAPATISPVSIAGGSYDEANERGFYVYGNSTTVTATLSNVTGKFNWCAYGSDYPPNILDYIDGAYTLRGTPPFMLKDANGNTQIVSGTTITQSSLTITPITMTDETGCPSYFCKYVGMDLHMNASYPCQQRAGGAQNWEAYIKDTRDNHIYRIVRMPTNTWWMADDLVWDGKPNPTATGYTIRGTDRSCGAHYDCGRFYNSTAQGAGAREGNANSRRNSDVCPPGWALPSTNEFCTYATTTELPQPYLATEEYGGPDTYGLRLFLCCEGGWTCGYRHTGFETGNGTVGKWYGSDGTWWCGDAENYDGGGSRTVRCVRDL